MSVQTEEFEITIKFPMKFKKLFDLVESLGVNISKLISKDFIASLDNDFDNEHVIMVQLGKQFKKMLEKEMVEIHE